MANREFDNIKTKDQLGKPDDISIFGPFKLNDTFAVESQPRVVFKRGTADFSKWGTMVWGTDNWYYVDASFILGNGTLGVLGTGILGVTVEDFAEQQITSFNNTAIVRFLFEDTYDTANFPVTHSFTDAANTTATVTVANQDLVIADTEIWTSKSLFKDIDGNQILSTVTVESDDTSNLLFEASADGGTNWETVSHLVEHTFVITGSDLRLRFTNNGGAPGWDTPFGTWGGANGWPTAFGTWGVLPGSSATITLIKAIYSI
jgi:hypothetical protein